MQRLSALRDQRPARLASIEVEMEEAVRGPGERPALVTLDLATARAPASCHDEGRRPAGDLQVLEVVIVAGQVEVDAVRAEQRPPALDQAVRVAVLAVR